MVIGGGFGGLFAAKALARRPVEVTLIDRSGHHLFQPLLYQVATGILSQGEIARPLREILQRQENASVLVGEVTGIDLEGRTVESCAYDEVTVTAYDSLVVAAGATHSYFGHEGFATCAPGLKSIDDALEIKARIFEAFERAEHAGDPRERRRHLTFAVVGGGPTGIEVAGQIRELAQRSLRGNYRSFDPGEARVVLLEAGPALLPTFGPALSRRSRRSLEALGVEVHVGARVVDVDETGVAYELAGATHRVESTTKVWAAGVAASPLGGLLGSASGASRTRSGQLQVLPDCTLPDHPEVFVVGDMMSLPGVPGVAQLAIQSGRFAARVIGDRLEGRPGPERFVYRDKGSLATIGRFRAVARIGHLRLSGVLAWVLWLAVHLVTLNGFRNRVTVTVRWGFAFVLDRRPERAATRFQARYPRRRARSDRRSGTARA